MIDCSKLQLDEQRALLLELTQFIKPIEKSYKDIEFYERFFEVVEEAILLIEDIYSTKKSFFKKELTQ